LGLEYRSPASNNAHGLQFGSLSAGDFNRAARHSKRPSQEAHQFIVRSAINWRRGDPDAQRAVMFANKFATRSTGNNTDFES
jgi:hypothetical protein